MRNALRMTGLASASARLNQAARRWLVLGGLLAASWPAAALTIDVKCNNFKVGEIVVNVAGGGAGVAGGFTSVVGGPPPTLGAAAAQCEEHHWNWYQVVTADNQIPGAPYVDPPKGGLGSQWADDLPWYWDEKPFPNPAPAGKGTAAQAAPYQLANNILNAGATLNYADFPGGAPGLMLSFKTWLVSLNADSSLHSFHEGFSWDFKLSDAGVPTVPMLAAILTGPGAADYNAGLIAGFATAVPEPASLWLWAVGLGLLLTAARRRGGG